MNVIKRLRIGCEEKAIALLDWIGSRSGKPVLPAHLLTGTRGEDAALFYLRRKGYVVVARRWSPGDEPGDIDLIAWQGPILCFVEVKTRTAHDMTPAEAAVDDHKRTMLRRLARRYVQQLPQVAWPAVRFDVIGVYLLRAKPPEFVHFESAFDMREQSEQR
jgi:putative endonuclease